MKRSVIITLIIVMMITGCSRVPKILSTELPLPDRIASTVVSNRPDVRYSL